MRRYLLFILLTVSTLLSAQRPTRAVSFDLLGTSVVEGISFDSRLKGNSGWGYRVGLGYSDGILVRDPIDPTTRALDCYGLAMPLAFNYVFGQRKHHLELGAGLSLGCMEKWTEFVEPGTDEHGGLFYGGTYKVGFTYFSFLDIAYRYQMPRKFFFRSSIQPGLPMPGKKCGMFPLPILLQLSFGYAF